MSNVITLAMKDLKLLTRSKASLFWILVFPLLLALFFGVTFGGRGNRSRALQIAIVDQDQSETSKKLIQRLIDTKAVAPTLTSLENAKKLVLKGDRIALVMIPKGYGEGNMFSPQKAPLEVQVDPSRQAEMGYLQGLLMEAQFKGMQELFSDRKSMKENVEKGIKEIEQANGLKAEEKATLKRFLSELDRFMQNADGNLAQGGPQFQPGRIKITQVQSEAKARPRSSFEVTFPSSVLWGILGCVQSFVISIAMERVNGTFLRIRFSPLSWGEILAGKALACFLSCLVVASLILALGAFVFGVRLSHPIQLIMAVVSMAVCFVGLLMLLSTLGKTVEGVAGAAWGVMMPLAMIGGGMIPLMVMPDWMLQVSNFSPVKWGIIGLEGAIWRGYSIQEMLIPCGILLVLGVVSFYLGVQKLSRTA